MDIQSSNVIISTLSLIFSPFLLETLLDFPLDKSYIVLLQSDGLRDSDTFCETTLTPEDKFFVYSRVDFICWGFCWGMISKCECCFNWESIEKASTEFPWEYEFGKELEISIVGFVFVDDFLYCEYFVLGPFKPAWGFTGLTEIPLNSGGMYGAIDEFPGIVLNIFDKLFGNADIVLTGFAFLTKFCTFVCEYDLCEFFFDNNLCCNDVPEWEVGTFIGNVCFMVIDGLNAACATWGTAGGFVVALFFKGECDKDGLCAGWGSVNDFDTRIWGALICFGGLVLTCVWTIDGFSKETCVVGGCKIVFDGCDICKDFESWTATDSLCGLCFDDLLLGNTVFTGVIDILGLSLVKDAVVVVFVVTACWYMGVEREVVAEALLKFNNCCTVKLFKLPKLFILEAAFILEVDVLIVGTLLMLDAVAMVLFNPLARLDKEERLFWYCLKISW